MVTLHELFTRARGGADASADTTAASTPTHTTVIASSARLLALQRHPSFRCLCNTCHVTTGSVMIAYIQLALTLGLAIVISASLITSTPGDRTRVIRQFYDGQRGVFTRHEQQHPRVVEDVDAPYPSFSDPMASSSEEVTSTPEQESSSTFATFFAAVFLALIVEAVISVCLLVGIKTERRWFLIPHIITSLFSIISTSMRLFSVVSVGSSDRVLSAFITIAVEFLVFWVPYRAFVYLRAKEAIVQQERRQRGMPFDAAVVIRANPNDAHMLSMAPPPSYSAAYAVPPAYKHMDAAATDDPPPAYRAPQTTEADSAPVIEAPETAPVSTTDNK